MQTKPGQGFCWNLRCLVSKLALTYLRDLQARCYGFELRGKPCGRPQKPSTQGLSDNHLDLENLARTGRMGELLSSPSRDRTGKARTNEALTTPGQRELPML